MNDTTRRFLTAIVERVPAGGEIVELRLFPAIRQGGIESGVAVVAVELPEPDPTASEEPDPLTAPQDAADDGAARTEENATPESAPLRAGAADVIPAAVNDLVDTDVAIEDEEGSDGDEHPVAVSFVPMADTTGEFEVADALDEELTEIVVSVEREGGATGRGEVVTGDETERMIADAALPAADLPVASDEPEIPLADILALPSPDATGAEAEAVPTVPAAPVRQRYAILTARYRLAIKGPDRGKWDVEITHEADAPLDTVERVARGVTKRAGESSDPEHFSGQSLRAALEAPVWATTA